MYFVDYSNDFDKYISYDRANCVNSIDGNNVKELFPQQLHPATIVYPVIRRFLSIYKTQLQDGNDANQDRFEHLCRYLIKSFESDSPMLSYAIICLQKDKRYI